MDTLVFELLSVDTLKQVRREMAGYMRDQLVDVMNNNLNGVDENVFKAFLTINKVLDEKEGN